MSLVVVKFGGSSVANVPRIRHSAEIVLKHYNEGKSVVVVTSAMMGMTNHLFDYAKNFINTAANREVDSILAAGEQIAAGLFALAIKERGVSSKSFLGWQLPILSEDIFSSADIKSIETSPICETIETGHIPIVAGFQAVNSNSDITTLGRGGSDATAVALACALRADDCIIYTDVDGVYTADPRIVLNARRIDEISYEEMLELASTGAKVLQSRSVLIAQNCGVKLKVMSSFLDENEGTIVGQISIPRKTKLTAISHSLDFVKVTLRDLKIDSLEILQKLFKNNIKLDFISIDSASTSFLINKAALQDVKDLLNNFDVMHNVDNDIGVVTLVGSGIKTDNSIMACVLEMLKSVRIDIKGFHQSELSLSIVVPRSHTELAVSSLHKQPLF